MITGGALDWLANLGEGFVKVFPQLAIVDTTQRAVRWRFGKYPKLLEPGLHIWWPLVEVLLITEVQNTTVDICKQSISMQNGDTVCVSGWITYQITDAFGALTQYTDFQDTLQETAAGIIASVVNNYDDLPDVDDLSAELQETLQESKIGKIVHIEDFSVSDYFKVKFSLLQWQP